MTRQRSEDEPLADGTRSGAAPAVLDLAALLGGETPGSRRFLGGLMAGALVGAAIAGSTIWRSAQNTRSKRDHAA